MHEVSIGGLKPPGNHVTLSIGAIGQNVTEFNAYTVKQKWFYDPLLNAIPLECYCAYKGNLQISSYSLQSFCYDLPLMINYGLPWQPCRAGVTLASPYIAIMLLMLCAFAVISSICTNCHATARKQRLHPSRHLSPFAVVLGYIP